jgi:prolyl-tRNA editing enzyme YbaK/EbsC (Cys-tRNA(Pro) deacylase)
MPFNVITLAASTRTAQEAAATIGCDMAQIVKSLVFRTDEHQPLLVLASGVNRVNESLLEQALGCRIMKAEPDFVREVTGFAIGGVPPVGHAQAITTLIDADLLKYEELWAAAGTPHAVFNLRAADLIKLTGGKVIAVK